MPACLGSTAGAVGPGLRSCLWFFPCVRVVSQPGAFDSSAVGMHRVLALGAKRWAVGTGTAVPVAWANTQGEWVCLFEIGFIFQRLGVMPGVDDVQT